MENHKNNIKSITCREGISTLQRPPKGDAFN